MELHSAASPSCPHRAHRKLNESPAPHSSMDMTGAARECEVTGVSQSSPSEQRLEHMNNTKPKHSKEEKKQHRKQAKAKNILLKHEGIETVSHPSKSLVVANGGLGNGVSRQQLVDVLQRCGFVESLIMPPNKPYSFVTYSSTEEAINAYTTLSGQELPSSDWEHKITLYLSFVDKVDVQAMSPLPLPPGLIIVEDFVSPEEELALLASILWETDNCSLPESCNAVLDKCLQQGLIKHRPDQLTVNQYEPGQGIPPHIDTHSAFEDEIVSLSLGAEIVMDFKHPNGSSVPVMVPRRSLIVMGGESRYLWTHGITPRKFDVIQVSEGQKVGTVSGNTEELTLNKRGTRTSFTFRKIRHSPCKCAFPSVCYSQQEQKGGSPPLVGDLGAASLEKEYVHKVYEDIAGHFSSTRHTPWPRVVDFLRSLPMGSLVADVGCGNGKYLGVNKDLYMIGCDRSKNLVDICGEKEYEACVCDALSVPFRPGSFDACISIAVVHHFATEERRLAALQELTGLLRKGGQVLIYVWAMEQEYNKKKSKYLKESSNEPLALSSDADVNQDFNSKLPVHTNRTAFDSQDLLVPWHLKPKCQSKKSEASTGEEQLVPSSVYHRYYHVFREGELEALCRKLQDVTVQHTYHDQGNWCIILEKL
ncbi:alkylated DNA repair protein alkB homolog 8 isoform X2 [Rana temporaria]|uniref:alkylated DNA repair protein alkB homolog 8 isoform X2 n=1 Tax=Rana temporaria TaxID=8407 RepID=UPI001AAD25EE|nr:alkylated DNA repair protein alkB homolog 8 isoform X2 [Rana temporaria]